MTDPSVRPTAGPTPSDDAVPARPRGLQRIWATKGYHRVAVVAGVLAMILALMGFVGLSRISTTQDDLVYIEDQALPAQRALIQVERSLRASQFLFTSVLAEPEKLARLAGVEDVRRNLSVGESAWRDYRTVALGLPDEVGLQEQFEACKATQDQLSGPVGLLLVGDDFTPDEILRGDLFAQLRTAQECQRDIAATLINDFYDPLVDAELTASVSSLDRGRTEVLVLLGVVGALGLMIFVLSFRSARVHESVQEHRAADQELQGRRNALEAKLQRALNMCATEAGALDIAEGALLMGIGDLPVEFLLADSSDADFARVLTTDPDFAGCPVVSPDECPAAQGTETKIFSSSEALDACPNLRGRASGPCSAVCVPVAIAGQSSGVLHSTAANGTAPPAEDIGTIELISDRLGNRLGLMRAMAERESQARIDPLTGLLNRRSLEHSVRSLVSSETPYVVAFGDLDHFRRLNDPPYGHETGDRALRLFARALRESLRPNDLAFRYGGEEFLIIIPAVSLSEAVDVVERVRSALARSLESGTCPRFTISFGLAESAQAEDFDSVVSMADRALLEAKADGRDRVRLAGGFDDFDRLTDLGPTDLGPTEQTERSD